ncbi:MAG: sensor protein [Gemmatimonadetes bacterium]|nr:sensor protein [Gemmatimonadota bacterium]
MTARRRLSPFPRLPVGSPAALRRIARAMVVTLGALVALAFTQAALYVAEYQSDQWVRHTRELTRDAQLALARAIDRETGVRGYLLSRDSLLLAPEIEARSVLPGLMARLISESADNPVQNRRAREIAAQHDRWERDVANPAIANPARFDDPVVRRRWMRDGQASFDALRQRFADFIDGEDALYEQRHRRDELLRLWGMVLLLAEVTVIGCAAWWSDKRLMTQAAEIMSQNTQLEEQAVELEVTLEESQEANVEREEAFAHLDAALASAPSAFAFVDEHGAVSRSNAAFNALAGRATGDTGWKLETLSDPIASRLGGAVRQVWRTGVPITDLAVESDGNTADGASRRRSWSASCYPVDTSGRRVGVGIIATETTQHVRMEAELRQAQKMEAIGQLAGGVAHDFNNVLTVISSYGEMLVEDLPEGRPRDDAEQIVNAARRAATLTRQLLSFSRKEPLQPEPVDLNVVITNLEGMLRPLLGELVKIVIRTASPLPEVICDAGQVEQVIVNLAVNARDAMPGGGMLLLETTVAEITEEDLRLHPGLRAGRYVILGVSDTGIGMDAETQSRIFEPFFTTKRKGEGTGIGLATVYGIVRQSGGHVAVYSEVGQGTTFRVWLPVAAPDAVLRTPPRAFAKAEHVTAGSVVLVADDEETIREVVQRVLEQKGYTVLTAQNGTEALETCVQRANRGEPVDLLITDVIMPEMSGPALAERAREIAHGVRVLFMSGYTGTHLTGADMPEGRAAFIEKPFTVDTLLAGVTTAFATEPEDHRAWSAAVRNSGAHSVRGGVDKEMARRAVEDERRAAASGQRALEAQHREVVDALPEGVMLVDSSGVIQMCNPSAREMIGKGVPLVGTHLRDLPAALIDAHGVPITFETHPAVLAMRFGEIPPVVFGAQRANEHELPRWWIGRARRLTRSDGDAAHGVVWSFAEITTQKQTEDELRLALEQARATAQGEG